eukprot:342333_1
MSDSESDTMNELQENRLSTTAIENILMSDIHESKPPVNTYSSTTDKFEFMLHGRRGAIIHKPKGSTQQITYENKYENNARETVSYHGSEHKNEDRFDDVELNNAPGVTIRRNKQIKHLSPGYNESKTVCNIYNDNYKVPMVPRFEEGSESFIRYHKKSMSSFYGSSTTTLTMKSGHDQELLLNDLDCGDKEIFNDNVTDDTTWPPIDDDETSVDEFDDTT